MSGPTPNAVWKFFSFDPTTEKASCLIPLNDHGFACTETYVFHNSANTKGKTRKSGKPMTASSVWLRSSKWCPPLMLV